MRYDEIKSVVGKMISGLCTKHYQIGINEPYRTLNEPFSATHEISIHLNCRFLVI